MHEKVENINWEKMNELIVENGYSQSSLSTLLGKSAGWISSLKSSGSSIDRNVWDLLKAILRFEDEDVLMAPEPEVVEEQVQMEGAPDDSGVSSEMLSHIAEGFTRQISALTLVTEGIQKEMGAIKELLEEIATRPAPANAPANMAKKDIHNQKEPPSRKNLTHQDQEPSDEDRISRAMRILEDMLKESNGKVLEDRYYNNCSRESISRPLATKAIKTYGCRSESKVANGHKSFYIVDKYSA